MITAPYPSFVLLPAQTPPYPTILDFLCNRFKKIEHEAWIQRIQAGKVFYENNCPITFQTPYIPGKKLFYFKDASEEPRIPFEEQIIFHNDHLLVAVKPHFLPVIPAGKYVSECLLYRLRKKTGIHDLIPINRIDKDTAGLVLFSTDKRERGLYQNMFARHQVYKLYEAITAYPAEISRKEFMVENRLVRGTPWFRMEIVDGPVNARTKIVLRAVKDNRAFFHLEPLTGKKHQLRVHLSHLGYPIINDNYYPKLHPCSYASFDKPLHLLAKRLCFFDPVENKELSFTAPGSLPW